MGEYQEVVMGKCQERRQRERQEVARKNDTKSPEKMRRSRQRTCQEVAGANAGKSPEKCQEVVREKARK